MGENTHKDKDGQRGTGFSYTYSAPTEEERGEIQSIRSAYMPKSEREKKMERLKKLDSRVRGIPSVVALTLGVVGLLIFGGGMSLSFEASSDAAMAAGIVLGVVGAAVMAFAKPLHSILSRRFKRRYREEILRLSDELLGEE